VSYEANGLTIHDVESFEKDAESGLWFPSSTSTYDMKDRDLKAAITKWRSKDKEVKED